VPESGGAPAVCVINHQGAAWLESTLGAIAASGVEFGERLLVDAGSTDRSLEIAARHPEFRVIELGANRGPGAARNRGLEETGARRVLFVDADVAVEPVCATRLADALAADARAAVAVPVVRHADDPGTIQYAGAEAHFLGMMAPRETGRPFPLADPEPREVGAAVTACFMVDRERIGGVRFDESFFIYQEDLDFSLRVRARGATILLVPEASCLHGAGTPGLSLRATGRYMPLRVFCLVRNRWQVILVTYASGTLARLWPALAAYEAAQLAGAIRNGWMREWLRAAAWLVRHAGEVTVKRRVVQDGRTVGDLALLSGGRIPIRPEAVPGRLGRAALHRLERGSELAWRLARRGA